MPTKYVKDDQSVRIVDLLRKMSEAVDKKGIPEGSASIIADMLNVLAKITADQALGGMIICISRDSKTTKPNVAQGTFVLAKAAPFIYYDLSGRAHALANRLADSGLDLDGATEEAEGQKEDGGLH